MMTILPSKMSSGVRLVVVPKSSPIFPRVSGSNEHAGKICVDGFARLAGKRRPLNHPITYDQLPLWMIYGCLMSFLKQTKQEALSLPVLRRGLLGLLRCRYYHIVKGPQLNWLCSEQEQHNCVSKQFLLLRQPEVRL